MSWTSQDSQRGFETTDDLSAQLRTAEQRIKDLEAEVRHLEDRADRAERWVYKIWVEIEQKFFGGDAVRFSEPPYTQAERS
jgi:chromosome segregation ATPase